MESVVNFFKKQGIAFYVLIVALIMAIVSVCMYSADVKIEYFFEAYANSAVIAFSVVAIILIAAILVVSQFEFAQNTYVKIVIDIATVIAVAFVITPMLYFIGDRVYHFGVVLGSDLERGNEVAFAAVNHSIVTIVMYGITLLCTLVAAFFNVTRKAKA